MVKSAGGALGGSKPVGAPQLVDIPPAANPAFGGNSSPAADVAPNGDVYVAWSSLVSDGGGLCPNVPRSNAGCHSASFYSKSTDGGATCSAPALIFPSTQTSPPTPTGSPQPQPQPPRRT